MDELTPISAATAPDPYPYYAQLVAERPLYRDDALQMWVASSAQAVEAVLRSSALSVRPRSEPVPKAIAGTPAGEVFGRFMRMTGGRYHAQLKHAALCALESFASTDLAGWAARCAATFPQQSAASFMSIFPAFAIATALGFTGPDAMQTAQTSVDFARALDAAAAQTLRSGMRKLMDDRGARGPLLESFLNAPSAGGADSEAIAANAIGFLFQSCDASAGLIGNTLRALQAQPGSNVADLVTHVARYDSPVQNTRRFAGDETILVLIAAANRDPEATRSYTFGLGAHACPAQLLATAIAVAAVCALMRLVDVQTLRFTGYRPSLNVRIPEFAQP